MIIINDPTDSRVQEFLTLRNKDTGDSILCDSEKVVTKLFETDLEIQKVFVTSSYYSVHKEQLEKKVAPEFIFVAEKDIIEQVVGYKLHHGVMAKAKSPTQTPINY